MSKPVLGRKLGTLLKVEAGREVNPTLLRGAKTTEPDPKPAAKPAIPTWYWLGADLLLVGLSLLLVFKGPSPISTIRLIFAIVAIALGCAFALWAMRPPPDDKAK